VIVSLVVIAGAAVALALGLGSSTRRAQQAEVRRRTIAALGVLQSVARAGAAVPYAADGIAEVLHLRRCRYEARPAGEDGVPVLAPGGGLSGRILRRDRGGLLLPDLVHLPAGAGRFALVGHPERSTTIEERVIAGSIAAMTAAMLEEQRRPAEPQPGRSHRTNQ
jgi:hypothetical protein